MNEMIAQGFQLMALGMGVVFVFLGLLVGIVTLVSRTIQKIELKTAQATGSASSGNEDLIQVIAAAVKEYRSDHPRRKR